MDDPNEGTGAGVIVLADGGLVISADESAAAILGIAPGDLVGRTVGLVETPSSDAPRRVGVRGMFDIVADLSSLALFSQDVRGRITSWNRGAERIFGYSESEVVGEALTKLVPEHLRGDLESVEERVSLGERVDRVFTEIKRKDGMPIPIALSVAPVNDASSGLTGAVGVAEELTETRLAQAALAEVEQRFREWEALAHVGRWLWDVGTDAMQWSDELHRMHGVDPLDFDGTFAAHLSVLHPDDRDRVRSLMEGSAQTGQPFEDQYRVVRAEGETRWFAMNAEPAIGSSGDVVGLRGVSHDVTLSAVRQ